jgi:hypothetical protein
MAETPPTIPARAVKSARAKHTTAMKRSLNLVADAVSEAQKLLGKGEIPADSFMVHAQKYDLSRTALLLLDALATEEDSSEILVDRADVALLIQVFTGFQLAPPPIPGDGTPLGNLALAAGYAPPAADGPVPPATAAGTEPDPGFPPQGS